MSNTRYGKPITVSLDQADMDVLYRAVAVRIVYISERAQSFRGLIPELRKLRALLDRLENAQ